jgi:hypothetical protein
MPSHPSHPEKKRKVIIIDINIFELERHESSARLKEVVNFEKIGNVDCLYSRFSRNLVALDLLQFFSSFFISEVSHKGMASIFVRVSDL